MYVVPLVTLPAGMAIAVEYAKIRMTIAAIMCLIACGYQRLLSTAIV